MLKVLPENISNLIAAGEVVSRPASVVKELVENAADAGATEISVFVSDAGRTSLRVMDNGCGMSAEEAVLCFERHATSKIAEAADLEKIMTYGFRGEALPSIASVAEVTLKTRRQQDEVGFKVEMAASKLISGEPVAAPVGTLIEVRNLFYNVPARRKFLKSDATELRLIVSEFLRVALIHPGTALRLVSNGRDVYNLRPVANLKQRIRDVFGTGAVKDLADVCAETSVLNISGFICAPEDARKTAGNQYFFVNGRFFKSAYLHKAVCKPYEKLIPDGYVPGYYLFLETAPDRVDVNIHPTKTEVKFEDEQMVFEIVMAAVREALGRSSMIPSIDFDQKGAPAEIPTLQSTVSSAVRGGYVAPPKIDYDPLFDPFRTDSDRLSKYAAPAEFEARRPQSVDGYSTPLFNDAPQSAEALFVLKNKYIIARSENGMVAVNIRRARERVFYESYLEKVVEEAPVISRSLFPQTLQLSQEDFILLQEEARTAKGMGFDIQYGEDGTIVVCGLPDGFASDEEGARKAVDGLLAALKDDTLSDDYRQFLAERLARSAASAGRDAITGEEARILLGQLYACRCPGQTADGRRTMTEITVEEIDRQL